MTPKLPVDRFLTRLCAVRRISEPAPVFHRRYENFSASNVFCFGSFADGSNDLAEHLIRNHEFDFEFSDNVHYLFLPSIKLFMSFLAPKLIDLAYRHPPDPDLSQSILYFLHLRRVNNGFNLFHLFYLPEDSFLILSTPARPGGCETFPRS